MKSVFAMIVITVGILMGSQASADQWTVRRATTSGACHVGKEPQQPTLGNILSTFADAKTACSDAQKRKVKTDNDTGNSTKCETYTTGAIDTCRKSDVTL